MSVAVFIEHGWTVYLLEGNNDNNEFVPTPFVPFATRKYNCAHGIMVTASHNPKADNGFKLYGSNGCQIIPPHDTGIASAILESLKPMHNYKYTDPEWSESTKEWKQQGVLFCGSELHNEVCSDYYNSISNLRSSELNEKMESFPNVCYMSNHGALL